MAIGSGAVYAQQTTASPTTAVTAAPYASILAHPEQFYNAADIVWVLVSSALVFIMIPALSLIYAGMSDRRFAMTMFRLPLMTAAVVGLQWVFWGYSLTFTDGTLDSGWYGGEQRANGLADVVARPVAVGPGHEAAIPELLFVLYEGMFAIFTAAIVCGGTMHRAKPARFLIFITLWSILVYAPIARWTWHNKGWSNRLGVLDSAGGTPVHITSGTTVAAFALFYDSEVSDKPLVPYIWSLICRVFLRIVHNLHVVWNILWGFFVLVPLVKLGFLEGPYNLDVTPFPRVGRPCEPFSNIYVALGTGILWFGWAGFNGGSVFGGNLRAVSAWFSTHIAACAGGVVGILWKWVEKTFEAGGRSFADREGSDRHADQTILYFSDGVIAGLVAITPASGYVPVWSAAIFGIAAALVVPVLKKESSYLLSHDPLYVFAVHAGAGMVGMGLTGLLADPVTVHLDGHSTIPFYPDYSKSRRFAYQVADGLAATGYSFFMTIAILWVMKGCVYLGGKALRQGVTWKSASGFYSGGDSDTPTDIVDDLQPTPPQRWRDDLERREAMVLEQLKLERIREAEAEEAARQQEAARQPNSMAIEQGPPSL